MINWLITCSMGLGTMLFWYPVFWEFNAIRKISILEPFIAIHCIFALYVENKFLKSHSYVCVASKRSYGVYIEATPIIVVFILREPIEVSLWENS